MYCDFQRPPHPQFLYSLEYYLLEHLLGSWDMLESGQDISETKVNKTRFSGELFRVGWVKTAKIKSRLNMW